MDGKWNGQSGTGRLLYSIVEHDGKGIFETYEYFIAGTHV
jgi:hypothetical protein